MSRPKIKIEDNFEKNLEAKNNIFIPFIIIALFSVAAAALCFYYGYGYYGLIIVGSIGSTLMLFTLVRTKRSLEDELTEYREHGPLVTQAECHGSIDHDEFKGKLTVYENGFTAVPDDAEGIYVEYSNVTAIAELNGGTGIAITYHNGGNHILSFTTAKLKVKAIMQAVRARVSLPELDEEMVSRL